MVDRTVYPADHTPELSLRQLFARHRVPEPVRLLFSASNLLTVDTVSVLGDTIAGVKATVTALVGDPALGVDAAARAASLLSFCSVWQACAALQQFTSSRRARMEEDPTKVPELGGESHGEMRSSFVQAHPDIVLSSHREPHKKFVERVHRDFVVHNAVMYYELGEIRVRSETITQKAGFMPNADDLLRLSREDVQASVTNEEDVMARIHAFLMTLEYLNICAYSVASGTVRYLKELEDFRKDCPGLSLLVRADKLIRRKVAELQADKRDDYPTFTIALLEVLNNFKYLWNEARSQVSVARQIQARETSPVPKGARAASGSPVKSRQARKRVGMKEKLKALKEELGKKGHAVSTKFEKTGPKGGGKGSSGKGAKIQIPDREWKFICSCPGKYCKFYNSSLGCKFGDSCKQPHKCCKCGGGHAWFEHHGTE